MSKPTRSIPPVHPRPVVLFDPGQLSDPEGDMPSDRQVREDRRRAIGAMGARHPGFRAIRALLCDELALRHADSLSPASAGTPWQVHQCGAQDGLAAVIAELDELAAAGEPDAVPA
jgi:hypothetical protein